MTDEKFARLTTAYDAGIACAEAVTYGTLFRGALPEADAAGYRTPGSERVCFITGYLLTVRRLYPRGVTVDGTGHIIAGEGIGQ